MAARRGPGGSDFAEARQFNPPDFPRLLPAGTATTSAPGSPSEPGQNRALPLPVQVFLDGFRRGLYPDLEGA